MPLSLDVIGNVYPYVEFVVFDPITISVDGETESLFVDGEVLSLEIETSIGAVR